MNIEDSKYENISYLPMGPFVQQIDNNYTSQSLSYQDANLASCRFLGKLRSRLQKPIRITYFPDIEVLLIKAPILALETVPQSQLMRPCVVWEYAHLP